LFGRVDDASRRVRKINRDEDRFHEDSVMLAQENIQSTDCAATIARFNAGTRTRRKRLR
jgi:hypothetical protein